MCALDTLKRSAFGKVAFFENTGAVELQQKPSCQPLKSETGGIEVAEFHRTSKE